MSFFIHDPSRLIITPLPEVFYRRKITDPDELTGSQPTRGVLTKTEQPTTLPHPSSHRSDQELEAYEKTEEYLSEDEPTAAELMSSPVICTKSETSIETLWKQFQHHEIHHIGLVSETGMLTGIASYETVLHFIMTRTAEDQTWRKASAKKLTPQIMITATPETTLANLAMVMLSHQVSAIPIITNIHLNDGSNTRSLEGIVTSNDILKSSLRHGINLQA
jgi:CBS domain-containing protein